MLTDLHLQHLRSYRDSSFELGQGVNIIVGPNASGKTNLLEAILVLARGSSYRAADSELVSFDHDWSRVDAHLANGTSRTVKLQPTTNPTKQFEINGKAYKRLTLERSLPVVLFEPNDLRLLSDGPERRRDYLDDLLEQTVTGYSPLRRQYKQTLAQRNALLKQNHPGIKATIFPWDVRLSQLAGQIVRARDDVTRQIDNELHALYKALSADTTTVSIHYLHTWPPDSYESSFLKKLESSLRLDQERGFTGAGPHREDLAVLFDERPAVAAASRGELRTAVLSLKILELKLLESARDTKPLLLLDDVFSELDGKRRHALTDYLSPYQTFITTTDADLVIQHFIKDYNVIPTKKD